MDRLFVLVAVIAVLFALFKPGRMPGRGKDEGLAPGQMRVVWLAVAVVALAAYLVLA